MTAASGKLTGPILTGGDRHRMVELWQRRRSMTRSALSVRLAVAISGLAVILVPAHPKPVPVVITAVGVLIATCSPARGGAGLAVLAGIGGWFACYGVHGSPPIGRVVAFAVVLYLLHSSTALAAAVPVGARLYPRAAIEWFLRCLLHLGIAGVLVAIGYPIERAVGGRGSYLIEVGGLLGVVAILGVIVWLFSRIPR